ncbi:MAG: NUDIX hydrolase [Lachnospiraceae bacterium]|nr:NUDIX hydrolase [Lachnospiraceae bacterium]
MSEKLPRPERIKRTLVHHGAITDIYADTMRLPDGTEETFDFIGHKGAAAVIPVLDDGRILMVRQYRNAVEDYTLEIPAGGRASVTEPTHECAFRELEEETGYYAKREDVTFLLTMYTTVAFCNEKIDIYVARNLTRTAQHLDDDEYIDVYAYTIDELKDKILKGEIVDGKTIAGLMTYASGISDTGTVLPSGI